MPVHAAEGQLGQLEQVQGVCLTWESSAASGSRLRAWSIDRYPVCTGDTSKDTPAHSSCREGHDQGQHGCCWALQAVSTGKLLRLPS
jgi:hypothetical protein